MKRLWGRKVSDLAFYQFVEILKFKCLKHHRELHQVGQWTATTKPCSDCGYHNENLTLNDRQWTCPECGSHHDRDINAAINSYGVAWAPLWRLRKTLLRKCCGLRSTSPILQVWVP